MKYKKEQKLKGIDVKDGEEGEGDEPDTSSSPGQFTQFIMIVNEQNTFNELTNFCMNKCANERMEE